MEKQPEQTSKKLSPEAWRAHYEAWQQSGESQSSYCKRHGLKYSTFCYWRTQLKQVSNQAPSRFETLAVQAPQHGSGSIRIYLPNGIHLSINASTEFGLLREVLRLLGVSTC